MAERLCKGASMADTLCKVAAMADRLCKGAPKASTSSPAGTSVSSDERTDHTFDHARYLHGVSIFSLQPTYLTSLYKLLSPPCKLQ